VIEKESDESARRWIIAWIGRKWLCSFFDCSKRECLTRVSLFDAITNILLVTIVGVIYMPGLQAEEKSVDDR
jgi:hypothetical protein